MSLASLLQNFVHFRNYLERREIDLYEMRSCAELRGARHFSILAFIGEGNLQSLLAKTFFLHGFQKFITTHAIRHRDIKKNDVGREATA